MLNDVIDWGFNIVVSDIDVVWLKDPRQLFTLHPFAGRVFSHAIKCRGQRGESVCMRLSGQRGAACRDAAARALPLDAAARPPSPPCARADFMLSHDGTWSRNPKGDDGFEREGSVHYNFNTGARGAPCTARPPSPLRCSLRSLLAGCARRARPPAAAPPAGLYLVRFNERSQEYVHAWRKAFDNNNLHDQARMRAVWGGGEGGAGPRAARVHPPTTSGGPTIAQRARP